MLPTTDLVKQSRLNIHLYRIAKLLLGRKYINPDSSLGSGRAPLLLALANGCEGPWGVVNLLLGPKEVDPDSSIKSGRTMPSWATRNGHVGIVNILLGRKNVNPNRACQYGRTPLLLEWA